MEPVSLIVILVVVVIIARAVMGTSQPAEPGWRGGGPEAPKLTGQPITRTYKGTPAVAAAAMQSDAAALAREHYHPTNQQYTPGQWGCGAFLLALLLAIVLIGILIFIYLIVVKPAGTLIVTYEYRGPRSEPAAQLPDAGATLDALVRMRDAGHISPEEYEAKRMEVLARL